LRRQGRVLLKGDPQRAEHGRAQRRQGRADAEAQQHARALDREPASRQIPDHQGADPDLQGVERAERDRQTRLEPVDEVSQGVAGQAGRQQGWPSRGRRMQQKHQQHRIGQPDRRNLAPPACIAETEPSQAEDQRAGRSDLERRLA
jgi:hypothetical protein